MYHYKACGLNNIHLANGYTVTDTAHGTGVAIHDIDGLHRVIAKSLVSKEGLLTGREFRFLRVELDLSQKALGGLMDKTDQAIAKWEKGEQKIHVLADKALRDLYMESINEEPIAGLLSKLANLDRQIHELEIDLEETDQGWQPTQKCA
ncbi:MULTISPECIES: helix-turn-helix domain-containing protein [Nitrincola]|uniref:Putative zinc finger/helix-turn-helix protein, YgiT family n=1 Tax=Nitrincola nitratireducens TaxID=1229521 RepID=W9VRB9_9GAMM|nr:MULTISPECIES: helix-turn-helix domain-containing protein [Nitrincola]EXJ12950.1 putative zinc finger/helix-turn-helix protein, YgiT family [Nitrincola nitratireducens]